MEPCATADEAGGFDIQRSDTITFNALSLRPSQGDPQLYIGELLNAMVEVATNRLEALVQPDGVGCLPVGVRPILRSRGDARRMVDGLRSVGPTDLVHGLDGQLPAKRACPTVATVHDLSPFLEPRRKALGLATIERSLLRRSIESADAVITGTGHNAEKIGLLFRKPATVIPPAPPANRTPFDETAVQALRARYRLPERYMLQIGDDEPRHDPELLAGVCRTLGVPLVVAGRSGQERHQSRARRVITVPDPDLDTLIDGADVVAFITRFGGSTIPPLHALARRKAVIASDVGGVGEVIGPGAVMVPAGAERKLIEAVKNLWFDEGARNELAERGKEVADGLTWSMAAHDTLDVYRRLGAEV